MAMLNNQRVHIYEFSYSDIRHGFAKLIRHFPMEPPAGKNFWNAIYDFTGRADGANWCHGVISWLGHGWEIRGL